MKKILLLCMGLGCGLVCLDAPNTVAMNGQNAYAKFQEIINRGVDLNDGDALFNLRIVLELVPSAKVHASHAELNRMEKLFTNITAQEMEKFEKDNVFQQQELDGFIEKVSTCSNCPNLKNRAVNHRVFGKDSVNWGYFESSEIKLPELVKVVEIAAENNYSLILRYLMNMIDRQGTVDDNNIDPQFIIDGNMVKGNLLHLAVIHDWTSVVPHLIYRVGDLNALTSRGETALDIAERMMEDEIISVLKDNGAKTAAQLAAEAQQQPQNNTAGNTEPDSSNNGTDEVAGNRASEGTKAQQPDGTDDETTGPRDNSDSGSAGGGVAIGIAENRAQAPAVAAVPAPAQQQPALARQQALAQQQQAPAQTGNQDSAEELRNLLARQDVSDISDIDVEKLFRLCKSRLLEETQDNYKYKIFKTLVQNFVLKLIESDLTLCKLSFIDWVIDPKNQVLFVEDTDLLKALLSKKAKISMYDVELIRRILKRNDIDKNGDDLFENISNNMRTWLGISNPIYKDLIIKIAKLSYDKNLLKNLLKDYNGTSVMRVLGKSSVWNEAKFAEFGFGEDGGH